MGQGTGLYHLVNLDFEARVPVPFSIFPSAYRDSEAQTTTTTTTTKEELDIKLPEKQQPAGREGQYSSFTATAEVHPPPPRGEHRYSEEEVRITREEERYRRPGPSFKQEEYFREERRPFPQTEYTETHIEIDDHRRPHVSPIDVAEREFRERFRSVDAPAPPPQFHSEQHTRVNTEFTVDASIPRPPVHEEVKFSQETVEPRRYSVADQKSKMGYYDEDGHYHSFRQGLHKLADKVAHPRGHEHVDIEVRRETSAPAPRAGGSAESYLPNTVTIPCHHIRLGDFLMLQGRPCQVIRISTSSATGQYRYLGVDLFTKQLHEESSFISNPAPSVVVQTMLGPVFKQYRVLDMGDGQVTAMTETGDVKQGLSVIDQSNLWSRLANAFESGRGSVRILVLNDGGRELAVDMKVIHGSRL
ncbi:hypothetical protein B0I35DRAFT_479341 [Stachybotrys elegans]|uniref:Translation initiation factor 5A-like N-terminal domain-containing protein n=1 Tax=Stachybotrys elegans TaxID=80388 RepID=A0A8K0SPD3_9HYPO|nr:hypothetical protein B0I35DRAFT_479341 [Stachybotrys elegans]